MSKQRISSSFSYLIEASIAILIFALCSLICIALFVHARQLQEDTNHKGDALLIAQSMIENIKMDYSTNGLASNHTQYFSEELQMVESGPYSATWTINQFDGLDEGAIEIWMDSTRLLRLPFILGVSSDV